jgi:hypothetical protein
VAHEYLDDTSTVIKVFGTPTAEILDQMRQLAGSGVSVRSARPFGLQPFRGLVNSPRRVIGGAPDRDVPNAGTRLEFHTIPAPRHPCFTTFPHISMLDSCAAPPYGWIAAQSTASHHLLLGIFVRCRRLGPPTTNAIFSADPVVCYAPTGGGMTRPSRDVSNPRGVSRSHRAQVIGQAIR